MTPDPLLTEPGVVLADWIRERRVSSREVVDAHIAQIERVNPVINAVVATRFEEARREADAADVALARGEVRGAFHGVPCTIKECFALEGMPQTAGLVRRRGYRAESDATAVRRLRAAGAIPLGVTNVSELCMWMESYNHVYGRTNNAYDPARIVGGSSGGEGAIVSAGGAPFGLGSDVGGSIRGPAFFNGVFGHKPTGGMVPGTGQFPHAENEGQRYVTTGPLARRAADLMPVLRILAGPDDVDTGCEPFELGDPTTVDLAGRTLLVIESDGVLDPAPELVEAQAEAAKALERRGMRRRSARFASLARSFPIWSAMLGLSQDTAFGEMLGPSTPLAALRELARIAVGRSDHTIMAALLALTDPVPRAWPRHARRLAEEGRALRAELTRELGAGGLLLYPSYTTTAPRHGQPVRDALRLKMPFAYFGIMNVLELPSTQVPLGLDRAGLPLGVQVVGSHGQDHLTIAAACELERAMGGWVPPALAGLAAAS
ncbi:MAG: amidase [Polyangiaceae bacterium]|nr:amidase [Polyangiaceae bacterium]